MPTPSAPSSPRQRLGRIGTVLLLLGLSRPGLSQTAPPPAPDPPRFWGHAYLFPTTRFGDYDLCLERPEEKDRVTPRLSEMRAEARDQATGRTLAARVTPLPAPLPLPGSGDLLHDRTRTWVGLRWDAAGLPPGLYVLSVTLPVEWADGAGHSSRTTETDSLPVYFPQPDSLRAARAAFEGRRVWPQTGLNKSDFSTFSFSERTSFRIRSITRVPQPYVDLTMNGGHGEGWDMSDADFVTHDPLRVVFDRPRHLKIVGFSLSERIPAKARPPQPPFFQDFADPWQMERALLLTPPPARTPRLRPGLTPEQVIAALGWPTEYGSLTQLKRRASWVYATMRPFHATAYFSRGRFVRFDPGGHLP